MRAAAHPGGLQAIVLAVLASLVIHSSSQAGDEFYATSGFWLVRLDAASGVEKSRQWVSGTPPGTQLTYDGERLLTLRRLSQPFPVEVVAVHPADARSMLRGETGFVWNVAGIDTDPTTGVVYAVWIDQLYRITPASGVATHQALVAGLLPGDCLCALAIDSAGRAFGVGNRQGGPSIYDLDLTSGIASFRGLIQVPAFGLRVTDMSFDSQDSLWAFLFGTSSNAEQGLYQIDIGQLTSSKAVALPTTNYSGIAFVPTGPKAVYCTPKVNSLGCSPSISADGLASVTGTAGFRIECSNVRNNTAGFLLWSTRGPQAVPFFGGTLCVAPRLRRTPLVPSGGSAHPVRDCTGNWEIDFNSLLFSKQIAFMAGKQINCQWMGRDGGFAPPNGIALSDALEFTLGP